jgi:hypothetical protein
MQITNSQLIFEGLRRPQLVMTFNETSAQYSNSTDDIAILERYFSDVQNLFMKNLSDFSLGFSPGFSNSDLLTETTFDSEAVKLRALLNELIKVKSLISSSSSGRTPTKPREVLKRKSSRRP